MPKIVKPRRLKWDRFVAGVGSFLFGSLQNFVGGLLLVLFFIALAVYFGIKLVVPQ